MSDVVEALRKRAKELGDQTAYFYADEIRVPRKRYVVLLGWTDTIRIGPFYGKDAALEYAATEGPRWRGGARVVHRRTGKVVWQERGSSRLPGRTALVASKKKAEHLESRLREVEAERDQVRAELAELKRGGERWAAELQLAVASRERLEADLQEAREALEAIDLHERMPAGEEWDVAYYEVVELARGVLRKGDTDAG